MFVSPRLRQRSDRAEIWIEDSECVGLHFVRLDQEEAGGEGRYLLGQK